MKKILIPTDFSDCAANAVQVGLELAKKSNAELHFLHVLSTPVDWKKLRKEQEKNFPDTLHEIGHAKAMLTQLEQKSKKAEIKTKTSLVFDNNEISTIINNYDHDFIIMGSHGTKGIKEVLGSNTQKVVRNSFSPVLVIKKKFKKWEIKNIVFASDFEKDVHFPFRKIIEFADLMKAQIHLLNVNMPFHFNETDETESKMDSFLKKCPRGTCTINIYNALNEERGIEKFSKKIKADVIAMTTHGKTGFMKMIAPSITESLVNHCDIPILSINLKK
ncbi:MAG: universal stress protein [Flavobacteriales bacterium]|nr:universal stress protein [Flavobacteriales bacterium]MCB9334720.1 universal stress protein [Flavobacteriales bacterium]